MIRQFDSVAYRRREMCRICGGGRLRLFLPLGPMPLANMFLRSPEEFANEARFPLDVYFCEDCFLVQLLDVIHPEILFRDYIYTAGTSETMVKHHTEHAQAITDLLRLGADDLVIEIASNDGSLLQCFRQIGMRALGIEPAMNLARKACAEGIETINDFFTLSRAKEVRRLRGPARVVIANNVLAHVDDTQEFLQGCKELIAEDGLISIEVPYLRDLLDRLEYDTFYHEHLCYFSAGSLWRLCEAVGLSITRMDRVPVHGGSLRVYLTLPTGNGELSPDVRTLIGEEHNAGMTAFDRYARFAAQVGQHGKALRQRLEALRAEGNTLGAYGAPAKGNTLLNYCGIDTSLVPFTVDKNPLKVGLYTPGMHIPVLSVSALLENRPDYTLILAWNLADEIMRQQREYLGYGGRFIIPVPEARIA